ncbi:hypothetical protein D3C71_1079340 [compost metagenome]
MLGLRKQIGSDKIRCCAAVGNHQHFRRTGRHINRHTVQTLADLAFRFGHIRIAWPKNFIDLRHRLGAKRQSGNGLSATHFKNILNTAQFCGIQNLIGNRRRGAEHHFLTTGNTRRGRQHQDGGKQRRRTAGNIQPDGGDRTRHLLAANAGQSFNIDSLQFLRGMEGVDIFHRHGHRLFDVVAQTFARVVDFLSRHLQCADLSVIKLCAVFAQRFITTGFNVIQDLRHSAGNAL